MRFPGIRLVEQTEQNFVASSLSFKKKNKTGTSQVGITSKALLYLSGILVEKQGLYEIQLFFRSVLFVLIHIRKNIICTYVAGRYIL